MIDELLSYANTEYNGKYIFGGTNTRQAPFTLNPGRAGVSSNPNGITGDIEIPVAEGRLQKSNIDGQTAFQGTAIFDVVVRLRNSLNQKSPPDSADTAALNDAYAHSIGQTGNAGLVADQLSNNVLYLDSQKTQLESLLSTQNDTDIAEAITKMKLEETNLQAALNVTAQIIPRSLLDYLK
jgi:flagellar hook-associated protein 3 FlgL